MEAPERDDSESRGTACQHGRRPSDSLRGYSRRLQNRLRTAVRFGRVCEWGRASSVAQPRCGVAKNDRRRPLGTAVSTGVHVRTVADEDGWARRIFTHRGVLRIDLDRRVRWPHNSSWTCSRGSYPLLPRAGRNPIKGKCRGFHWRRGKSWHWSECWEPLRCFMVGWRRWLTPPPQPWTARPLAWGDSWPC